MKRLKIIALITALAMASAMLSSCTIERDSETTTEETQTTSFESEVDESLVFANSDYDVGYDEDESVAIALDGDTASCDSSDVTIDGSTVTITSGGTYILSGTLDDGMVIVDAKGEEVQIVLNGVTINSETSAAIYCLKADKLTITLAEGTTNALSNGGTFEAIDDNNIDGVIFSKQDLTINGDGTLIVDSPAGNGIVGKDTLNITGGTIEITSEGHGIEVNDSIGIAGAVITIDSGKDGIQCENEEDETLGYIYISSGTITITADGDGISATGFIQIDDGDITIEAGGGSTGDPDNLSSGEFGGGGFGGGGGGMQMPSKNASDEDSDSEEEDTETTEETAEESDSDTTDSSMPQMPGGGGPGGDNSDFGGGQAPDMSDFDGEMPDMSDFDGEMPSMDEDIDNSVEDSDDTVSTKGIKADGYILINGGTFVVNSLDDSIHSNSSVEIVSGTFTLASDDDGIHANGDLIIDDCDMEITYSYEGLEGQTITIEAGTISIVSSDDGMNAATNGAGETMQADDNCIITINGGTISVRAEGDGIDSNGTLVVNGGTITVWGPTNGANGSLDVGSTATITGGTVICAGASGMQVNFDSADQGSILLTVDSQEENTEITVTDSNGDVILSATAECSYSAVVLSSPDLVAGETYTITCGDYSEEVTLTDNIYGTGNGMGSFGGGGFDINR